MKPKNIKILAIVFTALLVITVFPWMKGRSFLAENDVDKYENVSVNFSQFTKENVEKILIKQAAEEVTLVLKNEVWMADDKEISEEKINSFFQNLALTKTQKEVSKNKDNQSRFEVDGKQSIILTITSNGDDSVFFIGKHGPSYDSFYARKKGFVPVYLVSGNLKNTLLLDKNEWVKSEDEATESAPPTLEMP